MNKLKLFASVVALNFLLVLPALAASNPYTCAGYPQTKSGDRNACVQFIKWEMNARLSPSPNLTHTNNEFDSATVQAVIRFQATLNCKDGVVGPETWNALVPGLNQRGPCVNPTAGTTQVSADCAKLSQNFTEFGGGTPGPLAGNCYSPAQALQRATRIGFTLAGALTILFIVIGGYQYMTSSGDDKKAESGKKTIKWAVIGLGLVLFAYAIVTVVVRLATTGSVF